MRKTPGHSSFQKKLLGAFLGVGVIPLLVCVFLILNLFHLSLARNAENLAESQLTAVTGGLTELLTACGGVLEDLSGQGEVGMALTRGALRDTQVYSALYDTAAPLLRNADFSLYDGEGKLLYTTGNGRLGETLPVNWGLLAAARAKGETVYRAASPYDQSPRGRMQMALAISAGEGVAGYAVAELGEAHFARLLEGKYTADSDVLVLDPYWDEVYVTPGIQDEALPARLRECLLGGGSLAGVEADRSFFLLREERSGFTVVLRQPQPLAEWVTRLFYLAAGVSLLLCLALCVLVSLRFSGQIVRPIRSLNSAMAAVEEGDLAVQVEVPGTDEISQLSGRFNRMTQRLKTNLEDSLRQQQELGDAQIRMMQAQLNPHFLYNTLDTLKWLGKINRIPQVATISADLGDILRSSISGGEFVELREEVELLERYVEIQRIRFPGKFEYEMRVEEGLLDALVPKLMLQPLVENAIIHGFEDGSHGHIRVSAATAGEEMLLTVEDDGCGMPRESMERFLAREKPQSVHFGLYNVDAILRLYYGTEKGLTFLPPAGGKGTCIRVILPISRQGEGERE